MDATAEDMLAAATAIRPFLEELLEFDAEVQALDGELAELLRSADGERDPQLVAERVRHALTRRPQTRGWLIAFLNERRRSRKLEQEADELREGFSAFNVLAHQAWENDAYVRFHRPAWSTEAMFGARDQETGVQEQDQPEPRYLKPVDPGKFGSETVRSIGPEGAGWEVTYFKPTGAGGQPPAD
jgi:hypothetical protein